ncbi:MAG: MtnX-like HAD-IB family phosphatase [Acidobacteriia bacterium]|nr:MtnX-like HAD-IB family phosphatase [Terriglobia bacterium]
MIKPIIFCDFDGTITTRDTTDAILEAFAAPEWRDVEARWLEGKIGSRECLREQMRLVGAGPAELEELIQSISVTPGFSDFAEEFLDRGFPFHILSDGFDWVIERAMARPELARKGLPGRFRIASSHLEIRENFMITTFPHASVHCTHGCATCKPQWIKNESPGFAPVVFIGDGESDRHAIGCAELVFAKKGRSLAQFCAAHTLPFIPFEDFSDVQRELRAALAELASGTLTSPPLILSLESES